MKSLRDLLKKIRKIILEFYPLLLTIIIVIILFQYSFATIEAIFYDLRVRYDIGFSSEDNIVLITLDEESDEFLGEKYPYTYASHNRLMTKLTQDSPAVINYLINLFPADSKVDKKNQEEYRDCVLNYLRSGGKFRFGTDMDAWGEQPPPKELRDLGFSLALVNQDSAVFSKDDIVRRALVNISGEDSLHLWTANEYRKKKGLREVGAGSIWGASFSREADATFALFRYSSSPIKKVKKIKSIPFHRVVVGNFPKGFFQNKIVLVGPSYISNKSDFVLTPFNREKYESSKLVLHGQIIDAFISDKTVYQIPRWFSFILSVIISLVLSIVIQKLSPTSGLFITLMVLLGTFIIAYFLFVALGLWLYLTHIVLTICVVYYIWVPFRAIGEYQRRFAIQEEAKLLKQVENLKQNFISLMSHDLKTPVAKISGVTEVLLKQIGDMPSGVRKNLNLIMDSTKELNNFINSILDLTKVESRNLNMQIESKDINMIIEAIVEKLKYEAHVRNIKVHTVLSPLYPIKIDLKLMTRVVSNLVENAIKYSGEGSQITIKTWDDDKWVYVEIKDNGVGIAPVDLQHIFDKFYRVKKGALQGIKGTGLGLYLVKYFVELHGGTIKATSGPGEGATFVVKLKNV